MISSIRTTHFSTRRLMFRHFTGSQIRNLVALTSIVGLGLLPISASSSEVYAYADVIIGASDNVVRDKQIFGPPQPGAHAQAQDESGTIDGWTRFGQGYSQAKIGELGAYALAHYSASAGNTPRIHETDADSSATWADTITISKPGMDGRHGVWQGSLTLDGHVNIEVSSDAPNHRGGTGVDVTVSGSGVQVGDGMTACIEGGTGCATHFYTSSAVAQHFVVPISLYFIYGQAFDIYESLDVHSFTGPADGLYNWNLLAAGYFDHTLHWNGTSAVLDDLGNSVADFSIASASGADYLVAAVPLPASGALLLAGLGLIGRAVRRC